MSVKIFAILLSLIQLSSCGHKQSNARLRPQIVDLSEGPVGREFCIQKIGTEFHVLYADLESLSLKMLILGVEETNPPELRKTFFLDRISYTPEIDSSFEDHLYLINNDQQHILYFDRDSEDKKVLKWINKRTTDDSWWIDIIPGAEKLLAALITDQGSIDLFLSDEGSLYLKQLGSDLPKVSILDHFKPAGDITVLSGDRHKGFTVFDTISGQLFLLRQEGRGYAAEPLFDSGKIHYSAFTGNDELQALLYDSTSSELSLLKRGALQQEPSQTTVTFCQGTKSVFFFYLQDKLFFLFNEVSVDRNRKRIYSLSLIYLLKDSYNKAQLLSAPDPIHKFKAIYSERKLYIVFLQEVLKLLSIDLSDLLSVQNQDL